MIQSLMRSIGAIIASLIIAIALIIAVEFITTSFHPFPDGADTTDRKLSRLISKSFRIGS
jgi:hypothetical protein